MTTIEVVLIVHGFLRGVNYLSHCAHLANRHGLTGHARNLSNSAVEIRVCGNETKIDAFIKDLRTSENKFAEVEEIKEVSRNEVKNPPASFERL